MLFHAVLLDLGSFLDTIRHTPRERNYLRRTFAALFHASRLVFAALTLAVSLSVAADRDTRPVAASEPAQEIWLAPFPYGMRGAAWQAGFGAYDFLDLFAENAPWDEAASHVSVFKLYSQYQAAGFDAAVPKKAILDVLKDSAKLEVAAR